jgi:hypothetical protein
MDILIILLAGLFGCGITVWSGWRSYLRGHRAGFAAGRAEGYRSGVTRGHAAGVDQAAQLAHRLAAEPGHQLDAWHERFEPDRHGPA